MMWLHPVVDKEVRETMSDFNNHREKRCHARLMSRKNGNGWQSSQTNPRTSSPPELQGHLTFGERLRSRADPCLLPPIQRAQFRFRMKLSLISMAQFEVLLTLLVFMCPLIRGRYEGQVWCTFVIMDIQVMFVISYYSSYLLLFSMECFACSFVSTFLVC